MSPRKAGRRIALIMEFEPSWIAEFMCAAGILLWSAFTYGDAFTVRGWAWCMPIIGLAFGPARMALLFRLDPLPRVLAAAMSFVWWAWLTLSLFEAFGRVPTLGAFAALAMGDLLTVGKFSIAALRHREGSGDGV